MPPLVRVMASCWSCVRTPASQGHHASESTWSSIRPPYVITCQNPHDQSILHPWCIICQNYYGQSILPHWASCIRILRVNPSCLTGPNYQNHQGQSILPHWASCIRILRVSPSCFSWDILCQNLHSHQTYIPGVSYVRIPMVNPSCLTGHHVSESSGSVNPLILPGASHVKIPMISQSCIPGASDVRIPMVNPSWFTRPYVSESSDSVHSPFLWHPVSEPTLSSNLNPHGNPPYLLSASNMSESPWLSTLEHYIERGISAMVSWWLFLFL